MQYLTLDYLIVYAFLAITLMIGIRAGRGVKDIRDYIISNKSFGTGALVLAYLATNIAGATVFNGTAYMFSQGIIVLLALLGLIILYLTQALFIVPKVAYFKDCLTMGDLMETLYGRSSKIIAGILGTLTAISLAGMELILLGFISENLIGIKAEWTIVFGGLLLAAYASYGGIKSVTATDVFQFLVMIIVLPLIAYIVLNKAGGIKQVFTHVPADRFEVFSNPNFSLYLTMFLMWSFLPAGSIDPAIIQRWLMAKNGKQLRDQYLIIAAIDPAFQLVILIISFSVLSLSPHLESNEVIPYVIKTLLPTGMKGLAIASLLAVSMSSIDSYLHAAGITLTHDVLKPCIGKRYAFNELHTIRYITLLISILAIIIALYTTNTFELLLNSLAFTGPLLMFPLLTGIMGLKPDKQSFYLALVITLAVFISTKLFLPQEKSYLITLICILANGITFFGSHLIKYKGFAIVKREQQIDRLWNPKPKAISDVLKSLLPTPKHIIQYSQVKVSQYSAPYILFGVFFAINYIAPYFMWAITPVEHDNLVNILRLIGGVLCGLLIVEEKWPSALKRYLPNFWHLTVLYCLPFTSTIMFLLTHGSMEWMVNIMGIIILLFILVDWLSGLIIGLTGMVLGFFFYQLFIKELNFNLDFTATYLLIYQGIFGLLIGLIFARRRQLRYDQLATDNQLLVASEKETRQAHLETFIEKIRLIKTLKNANIQNLPIVVKGLRELRTQIKEATAASLEQTIRALESKVASVALALTSVDNRAIDYLRLETKPMTLAQLLEQLQQQLPNFTLHYIGKSQHHQVVGDPIQLVKLLKNTIVALPTPENLQQKDYYLTLEDTQLTYPLRMVSPSGDYVKPLPALRLTLSQQADHVPDLAPSYAPEMSTSALPNPTNGRELLLTENQRIIKAHYGYTNVDVSKQTAYDYYLYVIPIDVTDIRPPDMNTPDKELGVALVRANDQYPGAQEQEQAFLRDVKQKSTANLENVKEALELIKWYHGAVSRRSGEPYYLHPLAVAHIVLDWNQEEATIIGGLLHDVVEDTPMLLENIDMMFGPEVVRVVDYVTHFESFKDSFYRGKLNDIENKRMLLEATDKRALYVKIADRLHNMRTIEGHQKEEKKKKISQETLDFFVPLAKSLSLEKAAKELLDISTQVLNR